MSKEEQFQVKKNEIANAHGINVQSLEGRILIVPNSNRKDKKDIVISHNKMMSFEFCNDLKSAFNEIYK